MSTCRSFFICDFGNISLMSAIFSTTRLFEPASERIEECVTYPNPTPTSICPSMIGMYLAFDKKKEYSDVAERVRVIDI